MSFEPTILNAHTVEECSSQKAVIEKEVMHGKESSFD
jgi:hypothetical protein